MRNGGEPSILVVDDDPDILQTLALCLSTEGYRILVASNGREALDVVEKERPSVILLDLMMPVLNGFDVLNALQARSDWKAIPVVVVSANRGYEAEDLPGATSILRKPVNLDRLIAAVEQAVAA